MERKIHPAEAGLLNPSLASNNAEFASVDSGANRSQQQSHCRAKRERHSEPFEALIKQVAVAALALFASVCSLQPNTVYTRICRLRPRPFQACRNCSCSALRRASRAVTQHYEACFRGTGLRATQFTLLASLAQTGPLPISLLASSLGLERTSLTRNLRPLERKGFVETVTDDDRRIRRIKITKRGEVAALEALGAWKRAQSSVGEVLRRSDIRDLLAPAND